MREGAIEAVALFKMAVGGCVAVAAVADDWVSGSGKVSFEGAFMVSRDRDLKQGMTADAPDTPAKK